MPEFTVERLSIKHFKGFHQLFCEVFNSDMTYDALLKKYDTSYLGEKYLYIGYVVLNAKKEVISYTGGIPVRFNVDNKVYIGLQIADHVTKKEDRGKGYNTMIYDKVQELCLTLGVHFIFGFPTQNSHPIVVKHRKWEIFHRLSVFEISIKTLPLAVMVSRVKLLKLIYIRYQTLFLKPYMSKDVIIQKTSNRLVKDEVFYQYKCFTPNYVLSFKYGKVWLKITTVISIGEIEIFEEASFKNLINEIKQLGRKLGIHKIIFVGSDTLLITKLFQKYFPSQEGGVVGGKVYQNDLPFSLKDLQWSLGDYDTF